VASVLLATGALAWTGSAAGNEVIEANLEVVGRSDLGGGGSLGDVTVVSTTAIVGMDATFPPGAGCPPPSVVKVVDIKDPRKPRVAATIPIPQGMTPDDVESASIATAAFTGDLVALAVAPLPGPCGDGMEGFVAYHDVTDPVRPQFLSRPPAAGTAGPVGARCRWRRGPTAGCWPPRSTPRDAVWPSTT